MAVSYPLSVWDGDSKNRDSDIPVKKAPDYQDWNRVIGEVSATQTRIDDNNSGVDDDAIDTIGIAETVSGMTVIEKGDGAIHKTVFTLDEVELASTDATSDGAQISQKLYTCPEGQIVILGAHMVFPTGKLEAVTGGDIGFSSTADFSIGVGSHAVVVAVNLTTTEQNICVLADVNLTSKTSAASAVGINATLLPLDGSDTAVAFYLNASTLDDGDHGATADVLKISGTITIVWTVLGND